MHKIKAVVFDLDGVLVDAREWHYEALNNALGLFGYNISREEHESTYNGLPTRKKLQMLTMSVGLPASLHPFISEMKQQYTMELIKGRCRPDGELQKTLAWLKSEGFRLVVASNAIHESVEKMVKYSGLEEYFEFILSNLDVAKPKPEPDIYLEAAKRLGLQPEECVAVEDNINGIKSASSAGMRVVVVDTPQDVRVPIFQRIISEIDGGKIKFGNLSSMVGGWVIGNFEPSVVKTVATEVGVKSLKAGEISKPHVHRKCLELTIIVSGKCLVEGKVVSSGDYFVVEPEIPCGVVVLEDCSTVVVKMPSVPGDKYTWEGVQC